MGDMIVVCKIRVNIYALEESLNFKCNPKSYTRGNKCQLSVTESYISTTNYDVTTGKVQSMDGLILF